MKAHTSGEWIVRDASGDELVEVYADNGGGLVCWMAEKNPDSEANATLIAAAPELLSELKAICDYVEQLALYERIDLPCDEETALLDRILINAAATIAKAEGRGQQS